MNRVISTGLSFPRLSNDFVAEERIRLWREQLHSLDLGGSVVSRGKLGFEARASFQTMDGGALFHCEATASAYRRDEVNCQTVPVHRFALAFLRSGDATTEQYGRCNSMLPGDCCFFDVDVPFTIINAARYRYSALICEERKVDRWLANPQTLSGSVISQASPWGEAFAASLKALVSSSGPEWSVPSDAVIDQVCCLLALASGQDKTAVGGYHGRVYQRLQRAIRQYFADVTFSPESCAELCGISLRSLYMVFALHNSSFLKELKRYRLENAKYYLIDARHNGKTVAEISAICGFSNVSHFATSFKKAYGVSPSRYRVTLM